MQVPSAITTMPPEPTCEPAAAIGIELGQAFARLGSEVFIVEAKEILAGADAEARAVMRERLDIEGVMLRENAKVTGVVRLEEGGLRVTAETASGEETIVCSHILIAAGRRPVIEGLELERANVACNARGVVTNAQDFMHVLRFYIERWEQASA